MRTALRALVVPFLFVCSVAAAAETSAGSGNPLDESIDFKVTAAESADVFKTLGEILSAEVTYDPALAGHKLTLYLEKVRLRTTLTVICESLDCQWSLTAGKPARLSFQLAPKQPGRRPEEAKPSRAGKGPEAAKPAGAGKGTDAGKRSGLDEPIDIRVTQASVADLLRTTAQLLSAEASLDPKIGGKLDLDLKSTPVRAVLDRICREAGCRWSLVEGEKTVLQVSALK